MKAAHYKNQKGIGIVEVIAALGISVIVLTALVSLSIFSLRASLNSELQLEGTKIANREIELVRAYRDAVDEWENGSNGFINTVMGCTSSSPCYMDYSGALSVQNGVYKINAGTPEEIQRRFIATKQDGTTDLEDTDQVVRVSVIVSWTIGGDTKYSRVYTDLTNWANK